MAPHVQETGGAEVAIVVGGRVVGVRVVGVGVVGAGVVGGGVVGGGEVGGGVGALSPTMHQPVRVVSLRLVVCVGVHARVHVVCVRMCVHVCMLVHASYPFTRVNAKEFKFEPYQALAQ